ncbi:AEC family transporter [Aestuariibacter salexigens]|uniref:AEC family transporter n=1 Tax=Aestuariibacter salexigens TaxID=226010 RepID=UPI0003F7EC00|nr:AEC family transporter [Aestuariibacter salexigens]
MASFLEQLSFSFGVTGPVLALLLIGYFLKKIRFINDTFVEVGTKLVFNVTLPALLFITISRVEFSQAANSTMLIAGLIATAVMLLIMLVAALVFINTDVERGVVIHAGYRANMGVIGLAFCVNAYGDKGLAIVSLYLAILTMLYNVIAVVLLNHFFHAQRALWPSIVGIVKNPLIIGIMLALPVSYFQIPLPQLVVQTGQYFANMTLPLALLCTGATLSFVRLKLDLSVAGIAVIGKCIVAPVVTTLIAYGLGLRDAQLGVVFLMAAAPTAVASYVMVRSMGGNASLAANAVALSTLVSIPLVSAGIVIMRQAALM